MPKRALMVIDVQNEYEAGEFAIEYPPFTDTIQQIGRAMDIALNNDVLIVVISQMAPAESPIFAQGSKMAELHPLVAQRHADLIIEKKLPSAFAGTELKKWFIEQGVDTITIAGYMTQNCDDSTIKQAMHEGFSVEFLSDASGTISLANRAGMATAEELHRVMMVVMQSRFAAVMTTDEWDQVLQGALQIERDTILNSHHQALQRLGSNLI